jgi:glycosyltransferase involved in cell wall biosynthesis
VLGGHYRLIWPGQVLSGAGYDVDVVAPDDDRGRLSLVLADGVDGHPQVVDVNDPPACDVLVLQRPLNRLLVDAIPHLQHAGIAVVVELDDDFRNIHPRNASWAPVQPSRSPHHSWKQLVRACDAADWVTVTTPALAELYAPHGRVSIIPNAVPEAWLTFARDVDDDRGPLPWVGWSGGLNTHPEDLPVMGPSVAQLVNAGVCEFAVVGTGQGVARQLGIRKLKASGWAPLDEYPVMMQQLDVGVVPLEPTLFNDAKSWLKGLEFAALGVPFVASPTQPYRALNELGVGELAAKPRHWQGMLRRLVTMPTEERVALGALYRQRVREHGLTIEDQAGKWWAAWERAAASRLVAV